MKRALGGPVLALVWLGGTTLLIGTGAGCGGGGSGTVPALPAGADAAVAARSLALDAAGVQGPSVDLSGFYTADYHDDTGLTRTTLLQTIHAFLTQYTIVGQSHRTSTLKDSGIHVVESWSDTLSVQDKTANNTASTLDESEVDDWRLDNEVWKIDQSHAPPVAGVQIQHPGTHGRFRR